MSLIVLKDATCKRGISVPVPQLDPFGRPLTPQSASLLGGAEQAGRVPGKLIAGVATLLLAAVIAAGAVLVVRAQPTREPAATTVARPVKAPPAPKLLAPAAFSQAFAAAYAEADKHAHGRLDGVTLTARELDLSFQPKRHKRLLVTV